MHGTGPVVDLAFIDGMHLAEYALRDLLNTEQWCRPGSVVLLDDMLPRTVEEAGRGRTGAAEHGAWAGDVYKMIELMRRHRPDLVLLEMNTQPTGTLVILLPDPNDRTLEDAYEAAVPELVVPDPQVVPDWALSRTRARDPKEFLAAPIWDQLRAARRLDPEPAREQVRAACGAAGLYTVEDPR